MKYSLTINHHSFTIDTKGSTARIQSANATDEQLIDLSLAKNEECPVVRVGERFFAKINGRHVSGSLKRHIYGALQSKEFDGKVVSPFSGRVTKMFAAVGDVVESEAVLMVIEAMKMEYPVTSPAPGVVEEVVALVGDQVALGEIVARIGDCHPDENRDPVHK